MRAGVEAAHDVSALGISQTTPSPKAAALARELNITTATRPEMLKRKVNHNTIQSTEGHLEVSHGKTGPFRRISFLCWMTVRAIRHARKHRPEIIHAHDTVVLPIAVILRALFRAKIVYDAHELESDKAGGSRVQNKLILMIENICWPWISEFITVSDGIGEWYSSKFGEPQATIILNSPDLRKHTDQTKDLASGSDLNVRTEIDASPEDIVFMYVGALEPGRGIEELISVFSNTEITGKLAILGDGSIREKLSTLSQGQDNIFVLDAVPHDRLVDFIRSADYGFSLIQNISLSDFLCLPNKMFEYLHAGLTVVCSDFPEMSRVVNENGFGYAVAEDEDSIAQVVNSLCGMVRPEKISADRIQNFTWAAQSYKLQELYKSLEN